jgi:hypothetical protein
MIPHALYFTVFLFCSLIFFLNSLYHREFEFDHFLLFFHLLLSNLCLNSLYYFHREFSWDIVEPISFFVSTMIPVAFFYVWFAHNGEDFSLAGVCLYAWYVGGVCMCMYVWFWCVSVSWKVWGYVHVMDVYLYVWDAHNGKERGWYVCVCVCMRNVCV